MDFAKKYPNTPQAVVNVMMRALRFIHKSTPDQIVAAVPAYFYPTALPTRRRSRRTWRRAAVESELCDDASWFALQYASLTP